MKLKTINAILAGKFKQFLASIEDESVRKLVETGTIITGGSIVSLLTNQKVNDFDLYFKDKATCVAVANYYVQQFLKNPPTKFKTSDGTVSVRVDETTDRVRVVVQSSGVAGENGSQLYQYFETLPSDEEQAAAEEFLNSAMGNVSELDEQPADKADAIHDEADRKKFRVVYITSNAITLSDKIQLILRFYGPPDEIHKNYDFVHCTGYWTSWDKKTVISNEAYESIITKELVYRGSLYPICSVIRTRKFIERGWRINAGQYLKMCWQISKLDLTNLAVLDDQLIGVDSNYFRVLIDALKNVDMTKVDSGYIATIIDRIF